MKICNMDHPQSLAVHEVRPSIVTYVKTHFSISSPPQCRSQAVVCVSTPRMYPQSGYFLVKNKKFLGTVSLLVVILSIKLKSLSINL